MENPPQGRVFQCTRLHVPDLTPERKIKYMELGTHVLYHSTHLRATTIYCITVAYYIPISPAFPSLLPT